MVQYRITDIVLDEADDILDYIYENSGIDKSREFFIIFQDMLKNICLFPQHGALVPGSEQVRRTMMPTPFREYFVYWKFTDNTVVIISIWHTKKSISPSQHT